MLSIKRIKEEDLEIIAAFEKEIFPDSWGMIGLKESLYQNHTVLLGAWEEEKLVGYVIFYFAADEGEIVRIAVEPSMRRKGVASHLLLELENICEEKKIVKMLLDVRETNETAIEFYKSHGFTEDGIRKNFYTKPEEDAVLMSRGLGK